MNYTEIKKLHSMLEDAKIPHLFKSHIDGYQVVLIKVDGKYNIDAIQCLGSYGNKDNKIEIMGGITKQEQLNDSVLGWLSAEEVFKRFKYCYENKTTIYVDK